MAVVGAERSDSFGIEVVDDQTGRGVPLVELRTVHKVSYWTDSGGWVAFDEPGLLGREVFFHIASPGYTFPKDSFGYEGIRVRTRRGGRTRWVVHRTNIAERLYRVTGAGIYRDMVSLGRRSPLREPLLNAQVTGQDTVIATPYRGKLYWFWGDTDRASYPLGNFAAAGAVSEFPSKGGLDPSIGVDLEYFRNAEGFSRSMCPGLGKGLHWIEGVMTVRDENDEEQLVARVSSQEGLKPAYAWHLMVFDDRKGVFRRQVTWDLQDGHDSSHPFRAWVAGREYLFLYPNYRVPANLSSLSDLSAYEAYTCMVEGAGSTTIERDATGAARYAWRAGGKRWNHGRQRALVRDGRIGDADRWLRQVDVATGAPVPDGRGSVCWNEYRQRWIQLASGAPGDVWFSEADTPVGPWVYARKVVTHGDYNFYNPTQHPYFDQDGGRLVYFEGTYTASFSGAKTLTPRYDYNQIMYRLDLSDQRLDLPVPVYRMAAPDAVPRFVTRTRLELEGAWDRVREIAFLALPPTPQRNGLVSVFADDRGGLTLTPPHLNAVGVFQGLALEGGPVDKWPGTTVLYRHPGADGDEPSFGIQVRGPRDEAICRVWARPTGAVTWDPTIRPKPAVSGGSAGR
ncbi:MAG: hypothetical protein JNK85_18015 [Verrucomicrobiales bacterium]|nr:hypothetical protein [Verrucomicrobiales bacterium]